MKISKKKAVKASVDAIVVEEPVAICEDGTCDLTPVNDCKYASALELINAAIESLAEIAKDDELAKDSIANLGVVMLDLKGGE